MFNARQHFFLKYMSCVSELFFLVDGMLLLLCTCKRTLSVFKFHVFFLCVVLVRLWSSKDRRLKTPPSCYSYNCNRDREIRTLNMCDRTNTHSFKITVNDMDASGETRNRQRIIFLKTKRI